VRSYYVVLRSVCGSSPAAEVPARCRHCGLFFSRSAQRPKKDLRCPFGCSRAHRQKQSTLRSLAYYQEPEGKVKKQALNARRRKSHVRLCCPAGLSWAPPVFLNTSACVGPDRRTAVQLWEVIEMLERTVRQHRMVRMRRIDQGVAGYMKAA